MASAADIRPPRRPRNGRELGFRRTESVQWFAPSVLRDSALQLVISLAFGAFLDKRELQEQAVDVDPKPPVFKEDVWFDFIADTGDGFDATYSVAWLAGQRELALTNSDLRLPRGQVLVLGGDEVYPVGNPEAYENRFVGPFKASLPWIPEGDTTLWAIPGNHDWYDGLTSFFRVFCQDRWIGGRRTCQSRSYFAIQLPARWWIWGIDIQLDSYIDEPQKRYFEKVNLQPGDKVILCTGKPSWYDGPQAQGYKNLRWVERTLINDRDARLVLSLTGDSHHYAHYIGEDGTHKITSGGGGAFLHPTHVLPEKIRLPMGNEDKDQTFTLKECYPDTRTSKRLSWSAIALPAKNRSFVVVPGLMYTLLAWSIEGRLRSFGNGTGARWVDVLVGFVRNPVSGLILTVFLLGLIGFAKPDERWPKGKQKWAKRLLGTVHLVMHVLTATLVALVAARVAVEIFDDGVWFTAVLLALMFVLGALAGSLVMGLYLAISCAAPKLKAHGNEAFSAMRNPDYKNFLRIHLGRDGRLTVYPIGVREAGTQWTYDPDNADTSAAWLIPAGDSPVAHLIEDPIVIDGTGP